MITVETNIYFTIEKVCAYFIVIGHAMTTVLTSDNSAKMNKTTIADKALFTLLYKMISDNLKILP